jgi:uracil-DNA glycosylase family 4
MAGVEQIPKSLSIVSPPAAAADPPVRASTATGPAQPTPTPAVAAGDASEPDRLREPASGVPGGPRSEPDGSPAAEVTGDRQAALEQLQRQVASCVRCSELARSRRQTVFGAGNPQARLCFLGEAPGANEDRRGEPFVGAAGQLLDRILHACKLPREDVYILNVLKCRPPEDRTPNVGEVANCRPYFEQQLELIRPEFICCLGLVAAQSLLRSTQSLRRLRGRFHKFRDSRVLVTYHPAYLLRNPDAKRDTWEDMKTLLRAMGMEPE